MESIHDALTALRSGNTPPQNSRNFWSKEDLGKLCQRFWDGCGISQMAVEMGRTEVAIYQQLLKQGLLQQQCISRPKRPKPEDCDCLCPVCTKAICPNHGKERNDAGSV